MTSNISLRVFHGAATKLLFPLLIGLSTGFAAVAATDKTAFAASTAIHPSNGLLINGNISLSPVDQGWYASDGFHDPSNLNYLVGDCFSCVHPGEFHNFFEFDIRNMDGPAASLSLTLFTYLVNADVLTYNLNSVDGSLSDLVSGTNGGATFVDLGGGTGFGMQELRRTDSNRTIRIALNQSAVNSLNDAFQSGQAFWGIGGAITSVVPEPDPKLLMTMGVGAVLLAFRRLDRGARNIIVTSRDRRVTPMAAKSLDNSRDLGLG